MFGQAFSSSSQVMSGFLDTARKAFGAADNATLRQEMTNIMKINVNQSSVMKATQSVMLNQTQNVFMDKIVCKDSKINITQKAVVDATQNVLMQVVMNALMNNPKFKQAVRQYNGDYDQGLLDEQIDAGTRLPDACLEDLKPSSS